MALIGIVDVDRNGTIEAAYGAAQGKEAEIQQALERIEDQKMGSILSLVPDGEDRDYYSRRRNKHRSNSWRAQMTDETKVEAKPEKTPCVALPKQNGVARPKEGTSTGRVWAIADELSKASGQPAPRKAVMDKATAEGINAATVATQYGRWCRFFGIKMCEVKAAAKAAEAPKSDVKVEAAPQ